MFSELDVEVSRLDQRKQKALLKVLESLEALEFGRGLKLCILIFFDALGLTQLHVARCLFDRQIIQSLCLQPRLQPCLRHRSGIRNQHRIAWSWDMLECQGRSLDTFGFVSAFSFARTENLRQS